MGDGTSVLQVRDVPDDVRAALKERAAAAGTSMNRYVLDLLARAATAPSTAEVIARAARRAERAKASALQVGAAPERVDLPRAAGQEVDVR